MSESAEMLAILEYIKNVGINRKWFWISIKKGNHCLFSRRNGYKGKIIYGYSICLRLFNIDII